MKKRSIKKNYLIQMIDTIFLGNDRDLKRKRLARLRANKKKYTEQKNKKKVPSNKKKQTNKYSNKKIQSLTELKNRYEYEKEKLTRGLQSNFPNITQLSIWYKQKQSEILNANSDNEVISFPNPPDIEITEQNEKVNDQDIKKWFLKLAIQRYPEEVYKCLENNWSYIFVTLKTVTNSENPNLNSITVKTATEIMDKVRDEKLCGQKNILDLFKFDWWQWLLIGGTGAIALYLIIKFK